MKDQSFEFFDTEWKIKYVDICPLMDDQCEGSYNHGLISPTDRIIYISTKYPNGDSVPDKVIRQTVRHELVHLIFLDGQYIPEYNDEPLVEWVAKSIKELLKENVLKL